MTQTLTEWLEGQTQLINCGSLVLNSCCWFPFEERGKELKFKAEVTLLRGLFSEKQSKRAEKITEGERWFLKWE